MLTTSPTIGERANPYLVSAADALRAKIELASGCSIAMQRHDYEEDEGGGSEYFAWANEDGRSGDGCLSSRTSQTAFGNTEVACLDNLAKALGVFESINHIAHEVAA